ncbi:MAG TPA: hypothetical protein V6D17_09985 [Candidatus Obscuribacterales bacterium]
MISAFRRYSKFLSVFLCLAIAFASYPQASLSYSAGSLSADAAQAADILDVRREAEQIVAWRASGGPVDQDGQLLRQRSLVLRKILLAVLQVQSVESRLEMETAYAYDLLRKDERKVNSVNQMLNIANFAQLGTLYGLFEPYSRISEKFLQGKIATCTGAGLAVAIPTLGILYSKLHKASGLRPPDSLREVVDGKPVDGSDLPPLVMRYLDTPAPGTRLTRREAMNALWQKRYGANLAKKETLAGIDDGKAKKNFVLNSRIVLLWSLYTHIQGFDRQLLSLLNEVRGSAMVAPAATGPSLGLKRDAESTARLLSLGETISELRSMQGTPGSERKTALQLRFLENLLAGYLEMRIAADKCQEELNYQIDVVLAKMNARRGKFLQKTYEANFIQIGTLGALAGYSYLKGYTKAGNIFFTISNSIGLGITTISTAALHGGWRKNESPPNSLADFFDLNTPEKYGFTPLVWAYLNSPTPQVNYAMTRRELLMKIWQEQKVARMDLKNKRNLEKLGSMPSCRSDTIGLVQNRIALLSSLQQELGHFDDGLRDLLREVWPDERIAEDTISGADPSLNPSAAGAAELLGVERLVVDARDDERAKVLVTKRVLQGFFDMSADADLLNFQIIRESQVLDRMTRHRDALIQMTNIANFYQTGILGIISDSLGLSSDSKYVLYGNRVNIVSGYLICSLALAALLEKRGGWRPNKVEPNALKAAFSRQSEYVDLSPSTARYLHAVSPLSKNNLPRREELVRYWKQSKLLSVNVGREAMVNKLCAERGASNWWTENMTLIKNRLEMLYDLRAVIRTSNTGFASLLETLN